ncbi:hypothetical protein Pan216_01390 [Planctomycetes bacterium Pan216]|uniref:Calcineurin-like phosphoesterase n=2 Tax=Kolteria novifilia TaxID=2527975 RepID=A0A518AX68_9BACT|nr:hypothetical protein Pan216_01390 [Planctomycetes bacterium Pan216]
MVGDVVGKPGRRMAARAIPLLRAKYDLDLVVVNAENACGGSGINLSGYKEIAQAGADAFTMGDHIYKNRDIHTLFRDEKPICRPANYPEEAPGPDHLVVKSRDGVRVAVISLTGRLFMKACDCPLHAADRVLAQLSDDVRVVLVDIHAEATSEKQTVGRHLAGRVSAVVGTHTHVPTADATVFPPGTAYLTDLGMTGPYESIIGRRHDRVVKTSFTFEPSYFDVANGDPRLSGALIDINGDSGRARSIELIHLSEVAVAELEASAEGAGS